jgi:hypothetical protein
MPDFQDDLREMKRKVPLYHILQLSPNRSRTIGSWDKHGFSSVKTFWGTNTTHRAGLYKAAVCFVASPFVHCV